MKKYDHTAEIRQEIIAFLKSKINETEKLSEKLSPGEKFKLWEQIARFRILFPDHENVKNKNPDNPV